MSDSGFSSAKRCPSSISRPALVNPLLSSNTSTKDSTKEAFSRQANLPKPSPMFQVSRPIRPTRFFGHKNNGGYSPSIYSPKEMSPMSSLAFDFRDLNTSRETADTPRKRLSLSSVSSVDSLHLRGHPSPFSTGSALDSPGSVVYEDGATLKKIPAAKLRSRSSEQGLEQQLWHRQALWRAQNDFDSSSSFSSVEFRPTTHGFKRSCSPADVEAKHGCLSLQPSTPESYGFKPIENSEGCFVDTPSPIDVSAIEAKFDQRAFQDKDRNVPATCGDTKLKMFRRFKSMPVGSKAVSKSRGGNVNRSSGKENSPLLTDVTQQVSKQLLESESPGVLRPVTTCRSSSVSFVQRRRNLSSFVSPTLTSSPMTSAFSSSSSAFSSVPTPSSHHPSLSKTQHEEEELRKSAEEKLRDVKSPANVSLTPEKSVVPGSISSLSAHTSRMSRPASAAPFYRETISEKDVSPILPRGNKRTLDAVNTSVVAVTKRLKRNSTSEHSTRRRMAFSSSDRKVKSADVAVMHSSPISSFKSGFRPISAPLLPHPNDDISLSHSRLCSSNDPESDDEDMSSLEQSQRYTDEQLVEEIVIDNTRVHGETSTDEPMSLNDDVVAAPTGIAGLISGPLLASISASENCQELDTHTERLPRPRELFRSPSAPPLVPSKKSLFSMNRSKHRNKEDTPQSRRHKSFFPTLHESVNFESDDEPISTLNRSRSVNELDIIKAVELGCSDDNLIGDFSRVCSLDTVGGKCQDLKYITPETVMELIGKDDGKNSFELIDCRYPYEYEGGHIKGAVSLWEEEVLYKKYLDKPLPEEGDRKPPVLIFYCEFSSERGPRMARALRNKDRCVNIKYYPQLHYPEIYILRNGYKNFYHTSGTKEYCEPQSYRPMNHQSFSKEMRMCRTRCKTWAGENKGGTKSRTKRF